MRTLRLNWLLMLPLLLAAGLLWQASPSVKAVGPEAIIVTDETNSLQPQVAADSANNLHVVWYDAGNVRGVKYTKGTWNGSSYSWSGAVDIYRPGGGSTFVHPRLTVDRQDQVHVVWTWGQAVLYTRWPAGGSPSQAISPVRLGGGLYPSITSDANNRLHVVWESQQGNFEILYREGDPAGNFSAEHNISNNGGDSLNPDVAVDTSGTVHVVWYDKSSGPAKVFYTRRVGGNWSGVQSISGNDSVFPSLAADGQNCVHMAWNEVSAEAIVYRRSCNGGELTAGQVVGSTFQPRRPSVGSTASGVVVVAWDSREAGAANIFYTRLSGTSWSPQQRVAPAGETQLWSDVAGTPNGNLAVVWEEIRADQFDPAFALVPGSTPPPRATPTPAPPPPPPTGTFEFAHPAFRDLWNRTDALVKQDAVSYSWIWGPSAFTSGLKEEYLQSPGQARLVQYFDKSRMEINQPDAPRGPFYVTNGRLADELITGVMQKGDAQYEHRSAARIAVAGDPQNDFPQYRDLQAVYRKQRAGDRANELLFRAGDGSIRTENLPSANTDPSMVITQRVAGLGIPKIFWDFINQPGQVLETGRTVTANPLFDWRYVVGEPLTEAYWTVVRVEGVNRGVLVQAFERRVLTYTPTNAPRFQVEMGNIGRHYFEWRYGVRP